MNRCYAYCAAAFSALASPAWAGKVELMPLVGFQFAGETDLAGPRNNHMNFQDKPLTGLSLGYINDEGGQLEVLWTHSNTAAEIDLSDPTTPDVFDVKMDRFHLNALFIKESTFLQPFASLGLGATLYDPSGNRTSALRFSFAVGGGVKWLWTDYIGLRLDGRWVPTVALRGSHFFCDTEGSDACYSRETNSYLARAYPFINNFEFTSGLLLRY